MSSNIFAPLEIVALAVTASEFSMTREPAERMNIDMSITLEDESRDYDREIGAHVLEQEIAVLARLVNQDDAEDERMRARVTIRISSRCRAAESEYAAVEYMDASSVSIAYGHARSCIATMTALSPIGQFLIPTVDPQVLLQNLRQVSRENE